MGVQCSRGDNCSFRHDIKKRGKWHSRIFLRALLRARMREKSREPEVPGEEVPVEECLDCPARIAICVKIITEMRGEDFFELIKTVKFVIQCCFTFFRINQDRNGKILSRDFFLKLQTSFFSRLWIAFTGTGVSTGGHAHSPLVSRMDQGGQHVCKFLCECLDMCTAGNRPWSWKFLCGCLDMHLPGNRPWQKKWILGYAHNRKPTVILRVSTWMHGYAHNGQPTVISRRKSECLDVCTAVNRPWSCTRSKSGSSATPVISCGLYCFWN